MIYQVDFTLVHFPAVRSFSAIQFFIFSAVRFLFIRPSGFGLMEPPLLDLHCITFFLNFQGTLIPHGGSTTNGNVHHKSLGLPVQPSMPIVPYTTSLKSLRHRVQVHLEILHSVRRMVFGVSMSKSGDYPSTVSETKVVLNN